MPRKGENIYKRKDGRWEGRYIKEKDSNNKTKYGYIYGKTYREVKYKLQEARNTANTKLNSKKTSASISFIVLLL